jgi:hypothetical protein
MGIEADPRHLLGDLVRNVVHHRPDRRPLRWWNETDKEIALVTFSQIAAVTPSARSANLIAGRGAKNGFTAPNKKPPTNQKHDLTGKAPYRFESVPLHRRVSCEPGSLYLLIRLQDLSLLSSHRARR